MASRRGVGRRYRKLVARMRGMGLPCWICGRPIRYDLPSGHPLSFEYDHYYPASRWREFGYGSMGECVHDPANGRPSHRWCNEKRQNSMPWEDSWPFRGGKSDVRKPAPPSKRSRAG